MLLVPGSAKHNLSFSFCRMFSMCLEPNVVANPENAPLDTQAQINVLALFTCRP